MSIIDLNSPEWQAALKKGLSADGVIPFVNSPKPGRKKGATLTIVNDAREVGPDDTSNRVTLRFRKPNNTDQFLGRRYYRKPNRWYGCPEQQLPVYVDVMDGCDNNINFAFVGELVNGTLRVSNGTEATNQFTHKSKTILDWTLAAARRGNLRTVRCLVSECCGRCGRKLSVPLSIDCGLGPECRGWTTKPPKDVAAA
jgi:hypothetical protein